MKAVRILIADDHEVVRTGVHALLEAEVGWTVCGEATNGREAVDKAVELRPDVVVLDVTMPELNGLEAARQIRRAVPAKVLVLTVHESEQMATEISAAGAHGYVLKSEAGRMLVDAIRAVLGERAIAEGPHSPVRVKERRVLGSRGSGRGLTPREREVCQLLVEGRSNKEVGATLGVTTKTAETHRTHIMAKLGFHSVSELVRYAIRNHIIEP